MANENISVLSSHFKDKISASERLLIFGLDFDVKNKKQPMTRYRSPLKKLSHRFLKRSVTVAV